MYKLIAMDFDGTLLNDKKRVTLKNKIMINKYHKKGYYIVGVTARALNSVKENINVKIFDYIILNNGCNIYDVNNKKIIDVASLDIDEAMKLTEEYLDEIKTVDFISSSNYYFYKAKVIKKKSFIFKINNLNEIKEKIVRMNIGLKDYKNIDSYCKKITKKYKNINCFVMQDSKGKSKWLVINPKNTDKKTTLEKLGKKLNITLSDMIFFGDGLNDIEVIEAVGRGVAMGNALDVVKSKANDVTISNNKSGIAYYLKRLKNENN